MRGRGALCYKSGCPHAPGQHADVPHSALEWRIGTALSHSARLCWRPGRSLPQQRAAWRRGRTPSRCYVLVNIAGKFRQAQTRSTVEEEQKDQSTALRVDELELRRGNVCDGGSGAFAVRELCKDSCWRARTGAHRLPSRASCYRYPPASSCAKAKRCHTAARYSRHCEVRGRRGARGRAGHQRRQ